MSLPAGSRLGPYEIVSPLGEGGMGEVYRARDTKLNRDAAIKVLPEAFALDADRLARFTREAQVLASLNHPNIAGIYGIESNAIVMELVEGEDLSALIARGAITLSEALPIAKQIADALEAAHEQGIIHRDLKPANIKVRADGTVKVLDFGLAKAMDSGTSGPQDSNNSPTLTNRATQMGMILGTAAYMAPEQARGKAVDRRADIWSFGVVLYEMLSGKRAFEGDDVSITLASVLKEDVNWNALPADLPSSLQRLLRRCLEKDPKRRLQAIGEARITIDGVIAGAGHETADAVKAAPLQSSSLGWKVAAGVFGVAAVALAVVALRHFREGSPVREVVRFNIPPPEGTDAQRPAISPDGRRVAFVAARQIWVHSLESSVSLPLPGTEGTGTSLVWSPDGRYIAFRLNNKLQKIDVGGGRPQPIADAAAGSAGGVAWSRQGVIVFGGAQGLMQVPEAGGTPELLVPSEKEFKGFPYFLPDGQHFLFSSSGSVASSAEIVRAEIFLGSLDRTQAPKRLGTTGLVLGHAASSDPNLVYLLLRRAGGLMAQAFDLRRLALTGDAMRIDADIDPAALSVATSSTTGVLGYETQGARGKFQLTWFDRTGQQLGVESLAGDLQAPNLSRDGKRLAIERREGGNSDIWVIDLSRGTSTRVTTDAADDIRPMLSPDGTRVAFTRAGSLYQKSAGGTGDEERLGDGETMDWSPDGKFISFIRTSDLFALPLFGERTPLLIAGGTFNERRGRFSPDSQWIAYESNVSGRYEIYLQSFPPKADKVQTISANGGDSAYWRADGKELFFHSPDDHIMAVDIRPGPAPAPGVPRVLFRLPAGVNNGRFVSTPDGQRFLVPIEVQKPKPPVMMLMLNWVDALKRSQESGK